MFCREQVAHYTDEAPTLNALGFDVAIIGNGTAPQLDAFLKTHPTPLPFYTDPKRHSYSHFQLIRGFGGWAGIRMASHGLRAIFGGHRQGLTAGDPFQQGGVIVVEQAGDTVLAHRDETAGDLLNPARLIELLEG